MIDDDKAVRLEIVRIFFAPDQWNLDEDEFFGLMKKTETYITSGKIPEDDE